MDFITQLFGLG